MKQYIRDKISQKLQTYKYEGLHPVSQRILDHLVVDIYQTLSSDSRCWFDMSFSHSLTALQSGNYHLPKELTYVVHIKLVNFDDTNLRNLDRLIYFDIVEYRQYKLDQLLVSN